MFDFHTYLSDVVLENRFARRGGFHPCACSGPGYLEDMLQGLRQHEAFVCISDVTDESLRQQGGGWFKRRVFTVYVVKRCHPRQMESYRAAMDQCRELTRQLFSRLLRDEQDLSHRLAYINVSDIRCRELGGEFLDSAAGLYFMLSMDEPADLAYQEGQWGTAAFDRTFDKYFA